MKTIRWMSASRIPLTFQSGKKKSIVNGDTMIMKVNGDQGAVKFYANKYGVVNIYSFV